MGPIGFSQKLFEHLFKEYDKDGSGSVDRDEMVALIRKLMWDQEATPPPSEIEEVSDPSDGEVSPRIKNVIQGMEEEIEEEEDPDEKKMKEELLLRFKNQIERPFWSDNIYMELNIENLTQCYIRAKKDLKDINNFFKITPKSRKEVLTVISKKGKRSENRI